MAFYETTLIIRPDLTNQQADQLAEKISGMIADNQGKILRKENWGLRTLAYQLNKHKKGHYVHFGFEAETTTGVVDKIETSMRQSDDIIRFLTVRVKEISNEPTPMMAAEKKPSKGRNFDA